MSAEKLAELAAGRFAQTWWDALRFKSQWEDGLADLLTEGEDYDSIGTDDYDGSLEIFGATDDWRLSEVVQRHIAHAGFAKVYVNHTDGWETHYDWGFNGEPPIRGWRQKKREGGFDISYWPESWSHPEWLETGYMRIVPDELEALLVTRPSGGGE